MTPPPPSGWGEVRVDRGPFGWIAQIIRDFINAIDPEQTQAGSKSRGATVPCQLCYPFGQDAREAL